MADKREETQRRIEVMQAYVDGKTIEVKSKSSGVWTETRHMSWSWSECDYRVKPEPREWWIRRVGESADELHSVRVSADGAQSDYGGEVIHVREVL